MKKIVSSLKSTFNLGWTARLAATIGLVATGPTALSAEFYCVAYSENLESQIQLELLSEEIDGELVLVAPSGTALAEWQTLTQSGSTQRLKMECQTATQVSVNEVSVSERGWFKKRDFAPAPKTPVGVSDRRQSPMDNRGPGVQNY